MISALVALALLASATSDAPAPPDAAAGAATPLPAVPGEAEVLTLEQVLRLAEERNLDLKAAQARLTQARQLARKAWSGYLPRISIGATYTYNSVAATFPMATGYVIRDAGAPTSGPDPALPGQPTNLVMAPTGFMELEIQKRHQLGAQVEATQALIAPALWPAIRSAYLAEEVAELSAENARREVLYAVTELYFGAARLREALEVQKRLLDANRAHHKDALASFQHGAATRSAVLRAEIDVIKGDQDVVRAANAYLAAKSALAALLDREPDFEVAHPPAAPAFDRGAELESDALRLRPDVRAARTAVELSQAQRASTRNQYLPSVGLFARYAAQNVKGFTGEYGAFVAGLALSWNILDGGLREAQLREESAKVAESRAQARAAELRARDEVRQALLEAESAQANRIKAAEQVRLARENANLVKASFDAGAATYLDIIDARSALLGAELAAVNESLNADLALLRLAKVSGHPFFPSLAASETSGSKE